jgi:MFS family permease
MLVIVGASMMAVFATVTSLVQLITTNEMRGRVMSVYNCAFRGGMPMGNLLSGWLVPDVYRAHGPERERTPADLMALYFLLVHRRSRGRALINSVPRRGRPSRRPKMPQYQCGLAAEGLALI